MIFTKLVQNIANIVDVHEVLDFLMVKLYYNHANRHQLEN